MHRFASGTNIPIKLNQIGRNVVSMRTDWNANDENSVRHYRETSQSEQMECNYSTNNFLQFLDIFYPARK